MSSAENTAKPDIKPTELPAAKKNPNLDALEVQKFDESNPGPTFEEIFPEYAYDEEDFDDMYETDDGKPYEYYLKESENCTCCQGFIYNCEGTECITAGMCTCAEGKELQPVYFNVQMTR